ncbi:MAG TPA: GAF domain-containing protein [Terriglobales bacterium]|nr:GAF domain-containing protein [Terriglobales bacterium]
MATHIPALSNAIADLSAALLREREATPRAKILAGYLSRSFPGSSVLIYGVEAGPPERLNRLASEGDVRPFENSITISGVLEEVHRQGKPRVFASAELAREQYAHLNLRQSTASLAYVPLANRDGAVALIEIVTPREPITLEALAVVEQIREHATAALATGLEFESERNAQFQSISRLTQLYDLERVFNSTIQMDRLLPLVTSKVRDIMEVQACNLWMVHGDELLLLSRDGEDPTVPLMTVYKSGDGIAAEVSDTGKAILITRPEDARLTKRNGDIKEGAATSMIAIPVVAQGYQVAVIEVINANSGLPFTEDDYYFMATVVPTVANALRNASLLESERKIEILQTLVEVSREITSSLNLDRIMQLVVNGPQKIMTYDRGAVALEHHGKLQLKALSGKSEINTADPSVKRLRDLLSWAVESEHEVYVVRHGKVVEADREETRLKFEEYFAQSGQRGFYAVPLSDEQGRLGVLSFESRDPNFLTETHFEVIKVLASQTTVALRNASLYTEVPFIGVLEPLLAKKNQFMKMEKQRKRAVVTLAVATLLFLVLFPLPMRVVGDATVTPETALKVQAAVEGTVKKVYVQEGDTVAAGTILAEMEDGEYRSALAAAQAKYATAAAEMNRALAAKDSGEAGIKKNEADYWNAEVSLARERLEKTRLRATQAGIVATPHLETLTGRKLEVGDTFASVVNTAKAQVDVAIDESDVPLLEHGQKATLKLESFPTKTLTGDVVIISPVGTAELERHVFYARVSVPNEAGLMRPGMQGRTKISTGWRPAGFVLFRGLGMWGWSKIWTWFGW